MADPVVQVADQAYYGLESRLAPQLICPNVGSFVTSMWPRTSWLDLSPERHAVSTSLRGSLSFSIPKILMSGKSKKAYHDQ